ncbi:AAA family ATPase [Pseudoalteromonas byunsanensis]|uniref:Uridine kinase n=1 Tax=Pseudoalteromonas byunsanensis TaxID=327939 RepID=A0A1S1NFR3_9GAMM|nr:AAA family ATPase [Pseudoalteromonas byunsanensis]OHU97293.1 hypothetical protein BIW53_02950 [Pseudoalteromonas byunsanensis]
MLRLEHAFLFSSAKYLTSGGILANDTIMDKVNVVAISGASGSGKTSVVKQLKSHFSCPGIHFDDYVNESSYPEDMKEWLRNGADVSDIKTPNMLYTLQTLGVQKHLYIFVEEPFGKQRACMAPWIDYVVLLDIPLDICLSRIMKRHIRGNFNNTNNMLNEYLDKYEDHMREIYIKTVNQVRSNCDLIVSNSNSVADIVDTIDEWLRSAVDL